MARGRVIMANTPGCQYLDLNLDLNFRYPARQIFPNDQMSQIQHLKISS
jgi:hypothetical protein